MRPIDALTNIDRTTISSYISVYGNAECAPLEITLKEWNKNKSRLFRAFGNKLRISKKILIPKDATAVISELSSIYNPYIFYDSYDVKDFTDHPDTTNLLIRNDFIQDILLFWVKKNYCISDLRILSELFFHKNLVSGYIGGLFMTEPYHFKDFNCTVKNGMKTIRTIQKVIKATRYPNIDLFEKWRNQVSLVQGKDIIEAKLVLSIHPIDFMTMSDNNCNWSSCMSWSNEGCYNAGTLEMMNSNVAVVAYLESNSEYALRLNETGEVYPIPNKSWRSLVFIHKKIILCGKSYPYFKQHLCDEVISFARETVKENLNWNYTFLFQRYQDMNNIEGNYYLRDWFDPYHDTSREHHTITFYTNGMYNDIIEAKYPHYYCCRNYVKEPLKICLSGPATCICCGERLFDNDRNEICSYDDLGHTKICYDCQSKHRCRVCGKIRYDMKYHTFAGNYCSDECIKDVIVFPNYNNAICKKENLQFGYYSDIVMFFDKENQLPFRKMLAICDSFGEIDKTEINSWIRTIQSEYSDIFKIYRVPAALADWNFANITDWNSEFITHTKDRHYNLYVYDRSNSKSRQIEKNILNLDLKIPLLEYLKGGTDG